MYTVKLPDILLSIPRNPVTAVGLPLIAGLLSGSPTRRVVQGQWYNTLRFPPGRPPRQAFPIVWTSLYVAMGYASHLAVHAFDITVGPLRDKLSIALVLYYGQLAMNLLWTPLFFVNKQAGLALLDSAALLCTTGFMTRLLHEATDGKTTYLLAPYCAWLSYATYLNGGIWWLNRGHSARKHD
ncbi:TspO/MBR-like protein [Punctularia strigosozonata HHB-11173 SS5]|uniref:TspO/MBR-like protein n=1 Tax=Punctularia strigosozonata (strain HHB-11173) TaxID=741275 RepID=UPI0004417D67|nr:TspO/MBR-like protein [Punctularia strigosozonata HHB-11173 SS5]EIN10447.1 TspO/MBR-like protein [Punctularia strigosozonata HHB-11173 SS5]